MILRCSHFNLKKSAMVECSDLHALQVDITGVSYYYSNIVLKSTAISEYGHYFKTKTNTVKTNTVFVLVLK
jgi:hypothetical protein